MVLCCCRGTDATALPVNATMTLVAHCLTPLSESDSRALLSELRSSHPPDEQYTRWCLDQAAGNPFYLYSIARSENSYPQGATVPFDIHNLASSSYCSLDDASRTLLEASLFLGRFATVGRVQKIAEIDDGRLLMALRRLEGGGLITFRAGQLRLAHALLEDAIRGLVPGSVAAALQARVARSLEEEYEREGYSVPLAWAAAESWLAAGDNTAAMRLLRHCAAQAAAVGEPQAAAHTLGKISQSALSLTERANLQDEIISYAEVGGEPALLQQSLCERIEVAHAMGASTRAIQELQFRRLEVELQDGAHPMPSIGALMSVLTNGDACASLRTRAGIRLLAASDFLLDESLAIGTYAQLRKVFPLLSEGNYWRRRAELLYETVFGDQTRALALARQMLADFPQPSLTEANVIARHDVSYALYRLGHFELARPVLLAHHRYMLEHHVLSEALYALLLLMSSAISTGDLSEAADWLQQAEHSLSITGLPTQRRAGIYSVKATLALYASRFDEAERLVNEVCDNFPIVQTPRFGAIASSLKLRIKAARGDSATLTVLVAELQQTYERSGHLGDQDHVVEALWCAANSAGHANDASKLLIEYLSSRRREQTPPDASLRLTTASDPAWQQYSCRAPSTQR